MAIGTRVCPDCGHQFTSEDPAHLDRPIDAPVLSSDRLRVVNVHTVNNVKYARHEKPGKPASLRVTYLCGLRRFSEWVCLEHGGHARAKALSWWQERAGRGDVPRTVDEALPLAWRLPMPARITVDETDKFPEIKSYEFEHAQRGGEGAADRVGGTDAGVSARPARPAAMHAMRGVPGWLLPAVEAGGAR